MDAPIKKCWNTLPNTSMKTMTPTSLSMNSSLCNQSEIRGMFNYDELEGIVGCYCTLVYPCRGHEGTVVADYGKEIVVRLNNGKELVELRDEVLIFE